MSKAFVIKNKEGQYFVGYDLLINKNIFTDDISKVILTSNKTCKELLKEYDLKDCEVVKITIAEGDLEEENRILKRALELACGDLLGMYCSEFCGSSDCKKCKYKKYNSVDYFIRTSKMRKR